jgi:hypothetical protein
MPGTASAEGLPRGNSKKKATGSKAKSKKSVSKAKRQEEDPASFKAGESDEDDD